VIVYGSASGPGPMHILKADGTAYCGVKRVRPMPGSLGINPRIHRRCEIAHKAAMDAAPKPKPRTRADLGLEWAETCAEVYRLTGAVVW